MHEVSPRRERKVDGSVNPQSRTPYAWFDFFTIYHPEGHVLARSSGYLPDMDIVLEYMGIIFICSPGYDDAAIAVEWGSLVKWVVGDSPDEVIPAVVETDNDEEYEWAEMYGG